MKNIDKIPVQEVIDMDWRKYLEIADYNKDPYKMCEDCIAEQKKKYNGRTPIVCKGLKDYKTAYPEEVLNAVMDNLSEEEKLELKGVFSAPEWFLANVKDRKTFSPRFHQDLVLKCSAKHKVIRMGRRCIAEYEEVLLADGSYKQIKDVVIGDKVFSNRDGALVENTVLDVIDNGYRERIYEIRLESGRTVRVTENHEILTDVGWKSIKTGLREGSFVSEVRSHPIRPREDTITEAEAKLLGYLLTDGYLPEQQNQTIKFTSQVKIYIDEVSELTEQLFGFKGTVKKRKDIGAYDIWLTDGNRGTTNPVKTWLKELGVLGVKKKFRNSTQLLSSLPDDILGLFLNRAWAGDGSVSLADNTARPNGKRVELNLTTGDDYFARTISNILFSRGIRNSLYWEKPKLTKVEGGRTIQSNGNYKIRIASSEAVSKFFEIVGDIYGKETNCILARKELEKRSKRNQRPFRMDSEFVFSRIKEIRKIEKEVKVYDLTVENDHNFITNGIVTHNCGKTFSVCLDIIHRVETAERPLNILVAAPQLTMINEIERTITLLVNATGKDLIASRKATPTLEIKFFNGSILQGITLSNDGTSARGKRADLIWVDEMDFVNRKALEALQAIEMDNPNVEVIYTSTPIGQGNLYRAENLENTKGFHYPSYVIPHFNDAMYESIKSNLSDIAYAQECFVGSTEVLTTKGPKPIKDITVKDRVYYDSKTVVPVIQNARVTGTKEVVEYFTYSRSFICTPDHKFPNREQAKVEIQHLSEVPVLRAPYRRYNREEVLARVIGFNIGAGGIDKRACFYSNVREDLKELITDLQYLYPEDGGWLRSKKSASKVDPMRYWLELGEKGTEELIALGGPLKEVPPVGVPPFVKNGSDNVKIEFIAGLMGTRGTKPSRGLSDLYPRMPDISMAETASLPNVEVFFKELESILESLGISTTLKKLKEGRYRLYIRNIISFTKLIGYRYCVSKEVENFKYACYLDYLGHSLNEKSKLRENVLKLRKKGLRYKEIADKLGVGIEVVNYAVQAKGPVKATDVDTFSEWCSKHVVGDTIYLPITNTKSKGVQEVYNIGVGSSDHSYLLANNIKTFNCLGLYGLDEAGVFQVHYIEECVNKHIPEVFNEDFVLSNRERFTIFIGVDWNHDLNGTRIVVTAYDKASDRFFVVEKAKIAKQQLTQAIAVDLVVELNRKYQADHICCDEGFGIGQVTELRQRGREQYGKVPHTHPDIKLVDTMSVQFGSSLEIRDPVTHETLKKNTKQYIVENTQKILEQRRLAFDDKEDNDLIMQMKNYVVESSGMRGHKYKPRDKKIGDHDLDAFMLCLYAFDFHFGDYIKPKSVDYGVYLPKQAQYTSPREVTSIGLHRKQFRARRRW